MDSQRPRQPHQVSAGPLSRLRIRTRALFATYLVDIPEHFDPDAWLTHWIELPQPALGGQTPAQLLTTTEGEAAVHRVLGAMFSGSYQ